MGRKSYEQLAQEYYGDDYDATTLQNIQNRTVNTINKKLLKNKKEKKENKTALNLAKQVGKGAVVGLATTPTSVLAMSEMAGNGYQYLVGASTNKLIGLFDKNFDAEKANDKLYNKLFSDENTKLSALAADTEYYMRNLVGSKSFEDLEGSELAADVVGQLISPSSWLGAMSKGTKVASKGSKIIKAVNPYSKLGKLDKDLLKSSDFLSKLAEKSTGEGIKNTHLRDIAQMFIPGVQTAGEKTLKGKIGSTIIQSALPMGMAEYSSSALGKKGIFGDYTPNDPEYSLIKNDKNLKMSDSLSVADYKGMKNNKQMLYYENLDDVQEIKKNESSFLKKTGYTLSAIAAIIAATRLGSKMLNRNFAKMTKDSINSADIATNIDVNAANRYAAVDKELSKQVVDDNIRDALYKDTVSMKNSAFTTGVLDNDIKLAVAPQMTSANLAKINTDPALSKEFNEFMSNVTKMSHDVRSSNIYNKNNPGFTYQYPLEEFYSGLLYNNSALMIKVLNNPLYKTFRDTSQITALQTRASHIEKFLRKIKLDKNPKYGFIRMTLQQISDANNAVLDLLEKSHKYSKEEIDLLRKNRTIGGYNLYFPAENIDTGTIFDKVGRVFKKALPKKDNTNLQIRGTVNQKTNIKPISEVFEKGFKNNVEVAYKTKKTIDAIDSLLNKYASKTRELIDDFIENRETFVSDKSTDSDMIKVLRNTKVNKYTKQGVITTNTYSDDYIDNAKRMEYSNDSSKYSHKLRKDIEDIMKIEEVGTADSKLLEQINENLSIADKVGIEDKKYLPSYITKGDSSKKVRDYFTKNSDDIYVLERDGKMVAYKMHPLMKAAFDESSDAVSLLSNITEGITQKVQQFITGKYVPFFALKSAKYGIDENFLLFDYIGNELNVNDFKRIEYLKEVHNASKDLMTEKTAEDITEMAIKNLRDADLGDIPMFDSNMASDFQKALTSDIQSTLLTNIKSKGAYTARAINDPERFTQKTINFDKILGNKSINRALLNSFGPEKAKNIANHLNFLGEMQKTGKRFLKSIDKKLTPIQKRLNATREAPNLGMIRYAAKKVGAIDDAGNILDQNKLDKVNRVVQKYTSATHLRGANVNRLGRFANAIRRNVPYGNIYIDSLAPKIRASGISTGIKNIVNDVLDLADNDVRYIDVLYNIRTQLGNLTNLERQKFILGTLYTAVLPAMFTYAWNHSSEENTSEFYKTSDYNKSSKMILSNLIPGYNIGIPADQETMLAYNLTWTIMDSIFNGSNQYYDKEFTPVSPLMISLSRSFGIDTPVIPQAAANISGYKLNTNPIDLLFTDDKLIQNLSKGTINSDMSETAFVDGVFSMKTTALLNTIAGTVGQMLIGTVENAKVGSQDGLYGAVRDGSEALFKDFIKPINLGVSNTGLMYNETTKNVYKKMNTLDKLSRIKDKSPKQQEIYEFVRNFVTTNINRPLTALRNIKKQIKTNKVNGHTSFNDRKVNNEKLQLDANYCYNLMNEHYNRLDKLLQKLYNTSLDTFMQQYEGQ